MRRYSYEAVAVAREIGNRQGEGIALYTLGKVPHDTGEKLAARGSWRRALAIFEELGAPRATKVRARLQT